MATVLCHGGLTTVALEGEYVIPARNQSHFIITVVNTNKNKRGREERKKKKEMKYLECLVSLPLNLVLSPLSFQGQYSAIK